jgi:hypothetical protein
MFEAGLNHFFIDLYRSYNGFGERTMKCRVRRPEGQRARRAMRAEVEMVRWEGEEGKMYSQFWHGRVTRMIEGVWDGQSGWESVEAWDEGGDEGDGSRV